MGRNYRQSVLVRFTESEFKILEELSKELKCSMADVVRSFMYLTQILGELSLNEMLNMRLTSTDDPNQIFNKPLLDVIKPIPVLFKRLGIEFPVKRRRKF